MVSKVGEDKKKGYGAAVWNFCQHTLTTILKNQVVFLKELNDNEIH